MGHPRLLEYFLSNERLYDDWFGNANEYDCKPWSYLSVNDIKKYQEGLDFGKTLIVLFVRDTSTWNDGRKGLVITDDWISIKRSSKDSLDIDDADWDLVGWDEIDHVKYNYGFDFYNSTGELLLSVPTEYLFKGYVVESVKNKLAHQLTVMASLTDVEKPVNYRCPICNYVILPSFKSTIYEKFLEQTNMPYDEKKLILANDLLVSYIWFLSISNYFVLFPDTDDSKDYSESNKKLSKGVSCVKKWYFDHCYDILIGCDHCDHDWNLFDEFDSIMSTNDTIFIRKNLTALDADIYCDGVSFTFDYVHNFKSRDLVEPMNALISLVKARCYFKLCKQHRKNDDEYSKYYQLATDFLTEYEKNSYKSASILKTYEEELRSEMSNHSDSNNISNWVVSPEVFSETELKYLEAFHNVLIDGNVSESDRRMLERLRISLGISELMAGELEAVLASRLNADQQTQLSENEEEYLSAVKDYLADGEITERKRRMLDTYRDALGISQERAKEIESMV